MILRTAAAALAALMMTVAPAMAQGAPDLRGEVASFVKPTQPERLKALTTLLDRYGLPYEIQAFEGGAPGKPARGYNVVVTLGQGDRDILLTAHYDAEALQDGSLAGAVVDNAASVVALVHAARDLKGRELKHRVRIIFFDQEELGLIGARAYAEGPDGKRVAAVINFDVNGYGDAPFFADASAPGEANLGKAVRQGCLQAGVDCLPFAKYPPSDHLAFRKIGAPATSVSILPRTEAHQMWLFLNAGPAGGLQDGFVPRALRLIHTPQDTMDAIEPETVELASKLAVQLVLAADAAH